MSRRVEISRCRIFSFWVLLKLGKMSDVLAVRLRMYAVYRNFSVGGNILVFECLSFWLPICLPLLSI